MGLPADEKGGFKGHEAQLSTTSIDQGSHRRDGSSPGWKPLFLRSSTLLLILCIVVLEFVALVALYCYSLRNDGIVGVTEDFHSLWKYGPTAFLTLTAVVWLQVEYRTKQIVPWSILMAGGPDRLDALSLDYFSPFSIVTLASSARRRHWPVTVAVLSTWMLQLAIVFSTGLLERELQPSPASAISLRTTANLMTSLDFGWTPQKESDLFNAVVMANSSCSGQSTTLPTGTTKAIVYQPVEPPTDELVALQVDPADIQSYTATVKYLQPGINCRPLHEKVDFSVPIVAGLESYTFTRGSLTLTVVANYSDTRWPLDSSVRRMVGDLNMTTSGPDGQRFLQFRTPVLDEAEYQCRAETKVLQFGCGTSRSDTSTVPWGTFGGRQDCEAGVWILNTYECRDAGRTVSNFTSTLLECRPDNRHGDATLRFDKLDEDATVVALQERSDESDATFGVNLVELVYFAAAEAVFSGNGGATSLIPSLKYVNETAVEEYVDFATVYASIQERYSTFATQVFRVWYFEPTQGTASGSVKVMTWRLTVQSLSFALLSAFLAGVALGCVYLITAFWGESLLERDPASMVSTVVVLSQVPDPAGVLEACHSMRFSNTEDITGPRWWTPWGATLFSRWITVGLVLTMIIGTEVSYQISLRNGGIAMADAFGVMHYAWTIGPAFIINGLALLILILEFNFRIFQPYVRLAGGGPTASQGLYENHVFGLLPARLWRVLRRPPQLGLAFVSASTIFASLSSIVIGDLFSISGMPWEQSGYQTLQVDYFDTTRFYNWSGRASAISSEILSYNILQPSNFTTDTYALARLAMLEPTLINAVANRTLKVTVPATRGRLNCTVLDQPSPQCSDSSGTFNGSSKALPCTAWDIPIPQNLRTTACPIPPSHTMQFRTQDFGDRYTCYLDPTAFPPGEAGDTRCDDGNGSGQSCYYARQTQFVGGVFNWVDMYQEPQLAPGCPGIIWWGLQDMSSCAGNQVTFAICNPYVEALDVEATVSLPDFSIQAVRPVAAQTPKTLDIFAVADIFPAWSAASFGSRVSNQSSILYDPDTLRPRYPLSTPFEALTTPGGPVSVSRADYTGTDAGSRQRVLRGLEALWARTTARLASDVLRARLPDTDGDGRGDGAVLVGELTDWGRRWVVQDAVSTRMIEGLYGAVLACLVGGFVLSRAMDRLLPGAPTSIGATVRLLEASGVLGGRVAVPEGAEGMSDGELRRADTFGVAGEDLGAKWWDMARRVGGGAGFKVSLFQRLGRRKGGPPV